MADHNEAMRLADACKHGWLENVDPDKCSLDDLLALLRKQAERIAELEARVHTCGPTCSKAGCINRRLTAERDTLRAEVERLRTPLTEDEIAKLVLQTVYAGYASTPHRDAWAREIGVPFARAIEAAKEAK